ncbi:MAG: DUF6199 family natural product biosynthesis protein [Cyanobacteria bacterium J06633_8]
MGVDIFFLIIFSILFLMMGTSGLLAILNPYLYWKLTEGWKYKNLEPSDANLSMIRLDGILMLLFTVFWLGVLIYMKNSFGSG